MREPISIYYPMLQLSKVVGFKTVEVYIWLLPAAAVIESEQSDLNVPRQTCVCLIHPFSPFNPSLLCCFYISFT